MISPSPDHPLVSHLERFRGLIQPGIVGNFTHCELTEIFANVEGVSGPQNVFVLAVMEERDIAELPRLLNPQRLSLQGLKGWSFGVCRTVMTVPDFERGLASFDSTGTWSPAGSVLTTGALGQAEFAICTARLGRFNTFEQGVEEQFLEWIAYIGMGQFQRRASSSPFSPRQLF